MKEVVRFPILFLMLLLKYFFRWGFHYVSQADLELWCLSYLLAQSPRYLRLQGVHGCVCFQFCVDNVDLMFGKLLESCPDAEASFVKRETNAQFFSLRS